MRRESSNILKNLDWITIAVYFALAIFGLLNIYAAIYNPELNQFILDPDWKSGRQFIVLCVSMIIIALILLFDFKVFFFIPIGVYAITILMLLVIFTPLGHEVGGNRSWIKIGPLTVQPAEFAKIGTALMYAWFVHNRNVKYELDKELFQLIGIIFLPAALILAQPDTGSAMVFACFIIVMYLDGLNPIIPAAGIAATILFVLSLMFPPLFVAAACTVLALVVGIITRANKSFITSVIGVWLIVVVVIFGTDFFFNKVLKDHQRERITVLLGVLGDLEEEIEVLKQESLETTNPKLNAELRAEIRTKRSKLMDLRRGPAWNTEQAKIAIGSGGLVGKGFREGTITKFDFVPEQHTDFIFCTIGEEHGFIGSTTLIALYIFLLFRVLRISQRQKSRFARTYGYCVLSIFFFHFLINIGMALGLFPVIGIPLPFFSYGGSSLWAFTILLFILIKLDAHRNQLMARG